MSRPRQLTRGSAVLAAGLLGAAAVAAWAWYEPRRLVVCRTTIALPNWPEALRGTRVAVIADLHAGAPAVDARRVAAVVARTLRERPDLVALLGDYVDRDVALATPVAPEAVARALAALRGPLGTFAVLGNHDRGTDGKRVRQALDREGITVLENRAVEVRGAAAPLWVAGLADAARRRPSLDATLRAVPPHAAVLLLAHRPDVFPRVPARVALTLAGHTHGGQVNLPWLRARVIPSRYGDRYDRGHKVEGGRHLFVSSGIGTSSIPLRLGRPPEVVILELQPAPSG